MVACAKAPTWQEQYDLGVRYLSEGNYQEAIIAFTAAIEIDPKQENAYIGLADAYIGMGDYEQARQVLQTAQEQLGQMQSLADKLNELERLEYPGEHESALFEADGMSVQTQGLSVQAKDSRSGTITIDALVLQDSYTVNRSSSETDELEYNWEVCMYTAKGDYSVATSWWAFEPGRNEQMRLGDMQHSLWTLNDAGGEWIGDVAMAHTAGSISWTFSVPEEYEFDFSEVERYEVRIWENGSDTLKTYILNNGD